ncbi:TIGR02147 family protein [Bdellovibrio sp. HCB2-146]|uniref:TIGR02147 family protein n=1 Tax=Bdellovibrio sp. HCB2-146 TaxID=3394362 RepID=UPI0039BCA17E
MNTPNNLQIWNFADAILFLKAYYEQRKKLNPEFSYAVWADELGLKSRSFLRLVLVGKRSLTESVAALISKSLKLNNSEARYFHNLVGLARATTLEQKETHIREITKLHEKYKLKSHEILEVSSKDLFDFLSSYKIPRLQVLLGLNDIEKTEARLAALLGVKESEVAEQLQILRKIGLADKDSQGQWHSKEGQVATQDVLGNIALQSFHRKSLEEAANALELPKETRRFQSLVMALTEDQFQEVHNQLRRTLENTLQDFDSSEGHGKKVYQINLNIIPATGPILRDMNHAPVGRSETKGQS